MESGKILALGLAVFCLSGFLLAQNTPQNALTLEECVAIALEQNPLILSSLSQYRAALARVHQAKAWSQPSLDFDSDLQPKLFDFKRSGESYSGLSQTVEFPGKIGLRGKIAAKESEEILADIDLLKLDLSFQVKQAFYGLLLNREKLKYAEQDLGLATDFLAKAELKHAAGDVALVEVLRARVEAAKAANAVRTATNGLSLAKAQLNFLLSRKKYEPLDVRGELKRSFIALDLEQLKERALTVRPEAKRIALSLEKESLRKKQAIFSYLPDFNLGLSRHRLEGLKTTWDFTLSFPIPLFFWQPQRGEIAEAEALMNSLRRDAEHLRNAISLEVEEAYLNALSASRQITLFEEQILTQAEEVYNMFLFSFQEGEIGGIELIEARRTLVEARKSYADALYNYGLTLAALEKSVGQALEGDIK
ncbi:MAG: TolC family protein [Candidatus Aminicenantes bacterium]|nr:TolC family protein [Candidatus Aminicenantes bacterium]